MPPEFTLHKRIVLKGHPDFTENWIQQRIIDDPHILGLGDVVLIESEKRQPRAGRLDLLLYDEQLNRRYEVELMLGPTDPSHIIRTIEYWDIERRRYPAYDHVAVLVAEDITSRFLNVMSLLAGSIPLIAIQRVVDVVRGDGSETPVWLWPQKTLLRVGAYVADPELWVKRFDEAGQTASLKRGNKAVAVSLTPDEFDTRHELLKEFLNAALNGESPVE